MRTTQYFREQVLRKRSYLRTEWIERVLQAPVRVPIPLLGADPGIGRTNAPSCHAEFIRHLPIHDAKWVISSAPTVDTNLTLLDSLRAEGYTGRIALTARSNADMQRLHGRGVDVVLRPFRDAAVRAIEEITGIEEDIPEAAR